MLFDRFFGRDVVDDWRHNQRRRKVVDLGWVSWPVRRVPRHTIHTGASSRVGSEPSASIATTPLVVALVRP
jgi:hypothetical protein